MRGDPAGLYLTLPGPAVLTEPAANPRGCRHMPLIGCRNVEKAFEYRGGQTFALRQITFEVRRGEFVTIMGPSGAG